MALAALLGASDPGRSRAASSDIVVTVDVPSSTSITNGCTGAPATQLGPVAAGSAVRTDTGAGVCRITFGSTNDTAQLRVGQADGAGTAMGRGTTAPAQLARASSPGRMLGVFGYDASNVTVVGRNGTVRHSINGANSYYEQTITGAPNLNDVEARPGDVNTWWIVGDARVIRRATNGTANNPTFTDQAAALGTAGWPAGVDINAITMPDANTIVLVGDSRWIAVSSDAGASWTAFQHTNTAVGNLVGVDAATATDMMAVDADGRALYTSTGADSSAKWSVTTLPGSPPAATDVTMGATNRAAVVGTRGYVASWNGTTWSDRTSQLAVPWDLNGVDARPGVPDSIWAVDELGGIWRSNDLGVTWGHQTAASSGTIYALHFANATDAYVAGSERAGGASHDGGASFASLGSGASGATLASIAASPTNGRIAIAVGTDGEVRRTTDGGTTWSSSTTGGKALHGVALANDSIGWAVGDGGEIWHTTSSGASWTQQVAPGGIVGRLTGVVAIDRWRAVAVGVDGVIITTGNGGSSWVQRTSGTTRPLHGVAASGNRVIAVGSAGTIVRSTDAGVTWTSTAAGSMPDATEHLTAVDMASGTDAYAALRWNSVWRSTDGGATWSQVAGATGLLNRGIAVSDATVFVVGQADATARSTDAGATFQGTSGGTGMPLRAAAAIDTHAFYAAGADALIRRADAEPAADMQVADWSSPTNDWDAGDFFGVCLQAVGGVAAPDWTVDTTNVAGSCEALDTDPWRAVPATATMAAHTTAAGDGNVDLVWGFRAAASLLPGTYQATVGFEAVAP